MHTLTQKNNFEFRFKVAYCLLYSFCFKLQTLQKNFWK